MVEQSQAPAPLCTLVIFGITGDLTKRLLYPAICHLGSQGLLAEKFSIIGVSHTDYTGSDFIATLKQNIHEFVLDAPSKQYGLALAEKLEYYPGEFSDPQLYAGLKDKLQQNAQHLGTENIIFYFAVPPESTAQIAAGLAQVQLLNEKPGEYFRRVIIEKPFGHDLASAKILNKQLLAVMDESQIFRLDHFLGKETVQNLLAFRFSNTLFEPIWNQQYIDNIQITVAETLGVELRGSYYEHAGALRDMIPNHLFQVLSLLTMEPPSSLNADNIQMEKTKALQAIQLLTPSQAVRGQYAAGEINNKAVVSYQSEKNVAPQSKIESYVALKLALANSRWQGVPFYLRTGKRLKTHLSEITIQFKIDSAGLFGTSNLPTPNLLRIIIQPNEGIALCFNAKVPGMKEQLQPVEMKFRYTDYFAMPAQTGYETILYDCMNNDHTLFKTAQMIELSWAVVQPILDDWAANPPISFPNYTAGSWGPAAADELLHQDGRAWFNE